MKQLFIILCTLSSLLSYGQIEHLEWMTPEKTKALEVETFAYFNASVESSITLEEDQSIYVDFGAQEIPEEYTAVKIKYDSDSLIVEELKPFMLNNVSSSAEVSIELLNGEEVVPFALSQKKKLSFKIKRLERPIFVKDTIVFGILALVLAFIFYTSHKQSGFWRKFYIVVPALLLCYLIPAIMELVGLLSPEYSKLYSIAKNYLLPAALILMTLGIDFKGIINLGPKAIIMFLTATVGIIIGGPIAIMIYSLIDPSVVGGEGAEAAWRGMATIVGSWIGGGANQNAMYETYKYAPELYGKMIVVDIVVANLWMAFLLWGATRAEKFDRWLKADASAIDDLKERVSHYQASIAKQANLTDYMVILGIAFGVVAISHFGSGYIADAMASVFGSDSPFASSFLWLVVIATTGGLILSATKLREYEGAGASKIGSVFIYILVATIGMKMELAKAVEEPQLILVGIIWMIVHVALLFLVAKIIKAPFFFVAVGSKANIGGAASAPIVAAAFHPSLTSVGALLAVLGYALGTYGAIACAQLMSWVAP